MFAASAGRATANDDPPVAAKGRYMCRASGQEGAGAEWNGIRTRGDRGVARVRVRNSIWTRGRPAGCAGAEEERYSDSWQSRGPSGNGIWTRGKPALPRVQIPFLRHACGCHESEYRSPAALAGAPACHKPKYRSSATRAGARSCHESECGTFTSGVASFSPQLFVITGARPVGSPAVRVRGELLRPRDDEQAQQDDGKG